MTADLAAGAVAPLDIFDDLNESPMTTPFVPLEDTFTLHSNPDSPYTIYLDFTGHLTHDDEQGITFPNPEWVLPLFDDEGEIIFEDYLFGIPFVSPAYDIDGDTRSFSNQELLNIQEAFLRVAEDFAPFNVNVTTEEPPLSDLKNNGDGRFGVRVVAGGSTFDWFTRTEAPTTGSAGGVALLGSFYSAYDTPAFAFEEGYGTSAKNLAEVISHEAGHTFGLAHDGFYVDPSNTPEGEEPAQEQYYSGHANWGPIMGASYGPAVSQWSIGEYEDANNQEDDLATISSFVGYRDDDFGDSTDTAEVLIGDTDLDEYGAFGLIEQNTDFDFFEFQSDDGQIQIDALPATYGANLDIRLDLYDADGNLVATGATDNQLSASLDYSGSAGVYYLSVTGDAFRTNYDLSEMLQFGYTDYGSLGQYNLTILTDVGAVPDMYEVNDTMAQAYDLGSADFFDSGLTTHTATDDDYFLFHATADGELSVEIAFFNEEGDLDLEVYDESGTRIAISAGVDDTESVTLPVTEGSSYYIYVYGFDGATQEAYSLSVDGPELTPDSYEENDTAETASAISDADLSVAVSLHDVGDEDYYRWQASGDGTAEFSILYDLVDVDVDFDIYDSSGQELLVTGTDSASFEVVAGDVFLIHVFSDEDLPGDKRIGSYTLDIEGPVLIGDRLEPNDPSQPTLIGDTVSQFYKLSIHSETDVDYFSFTAPEDGTLVVDVLFEHAFGDLDARVVSESTGQLLAASTSTSDDEFLAVNVNAGDTYVVEVYGHQSSLVPLYALLAEFIESPKIIGDYNSDGFVNEADRDLMFIQYGMTGVDLESDGNGDGVVDSLDYVLWRNSQGVATAVAAVAVVETTENDPSKRVDALEIAATSTVVESVLTEPVVEEVSAGAGEVSIDTSLIRITPAAPTPVEDETVFEAQQLVEEPIDGIPFVPLEDTFTLHSNPGADYTIYLDFDGHRTVGTGWNILAYEGSGLEGSPIDTPAYTIDEDTSTFSDLELMTIQDAFLRIAEDWAPFNVNVTTEEPDIDDLTRTSAIDLRWGVRVVIGGSSFDWLTPVTAEDPNPQPAGGVAFLNSFSDGIDTPAYAFLESGYADPDNLALVVSHEVGHTVGLSHDGLLPEPGWDPDQDPNDPTLPAGPVEYYPGHGPDGTLLWGPIMGGPYFTDVSQWSIGEYFMANNQEDDLAIITSGVHGVDYRVDDQPGALVGGQVVDATVLERDQLDPDSVLDTEIRYAGTGIIEQNSDVDYYSFYSTAGEVTINLDPMIVSNGNGANLDIAFTLYDPSGNILATVSPSNDLSASLTTNVFVAGDYFIAIDGVGNATPADPVLTGYSDYGSLGQYFIEITAPLGPPIDDYDKVSSNDFFSIASSTPVADYTIEGTFHQGGDVDHYVWTAGESGTLIADLRFLQSEGDIDLEILDANGSRIPGAISASTSDNEYIEIDVVAGESYIIHVYSPSASIHNGYTLWLDGPGVPLDGFDSLDGTIVLAGAEPNETEFSPYVLGEVADLDLSLSIHNTGDEDYFEWTSPGNGKLLLSADFVHTEANIDLNVILASERTIIANSNTQTDGEYLEVDVLAGETYIIHVTAAATLHDITGALYRLEIDGPELTFDQYDQVALNNTIETATDDLSGQTGLFTGFTIHSPTDSDYYKWTAPATGDFRARIFFFHENGDLDLELYNSAGELIGVSTSVTDNESITQPVVIGEDYFVRVIGYDGATQSNYALELAFAAAPLVVGDYDGNGFVDVADRIVWQSFYGATAGNLPAGETELRADGNGDGVVDMADYTVWRNNQGEGRDPADAAVPTAPIKPEEEADVVLVSTSIAVESPAEPIVDTTPAAAPAAAPVETHFVEVAERSAELPTSAIEFDEPETDADPGDDGSARELRGPTQIASRAAFRPAAASRAARIESARDDALLLLVESDASREEREEFGFEAEQEEEPLDDAFADFGGRFRSLLRS